MGRIHSTLAVVAALALVAPLLAAQPPSGVAQAEPGIVVVAAGLTNPRGFTWGGDGTLFVAEAGRGGTTLASSEPPVPPPVGPFMGGTTARVVWIADGCPAQLAVGLPSAVDAAGGVIGAADVAILDGVLYVLIAGGGAAHGNPDTPNGVYAVGGDGKTRLVADLGAWLRANPVANVPEADYDPDGSFFSMVADPDRGVLVVVESNSEQILSISPDGEVERVVDLSAEDQVPTAVALAPDGGLYVGFLSGAPYPEGAAKIVKVASDGTVTDVWTGLTAVTGIAVGANGTLYALELSTGNTETPPFLVPHSGRVIRQTGPDAAEEVATGLNFPVHMARGPDGALYVSAPALGAEDGSGVVLRIDPTRDEALAMADAGSAPACAGTAPPVSEVTVKVYDFGFDPERIVVKVGTTVTWINTGAVEHTTVAFRRGKKIWDSDIMNPGDIYSFTFDKLGSFDYLCGLHPSMKAHIEVTR